MLSVKKLAKVVNKAWDDFHEYYEYRGGKQRFEREYKKEINDCKNLVETKAIANIWRSSIGKLSPRNAVLMEQAVWLTLCLDWGRDSEIFFDYENKKVTCKNTNLEMIGI